MQKLENWRSIALCLYGVLSLTSMAGMGIGGGIFALASLVVLLRSPWASVSKPFFETRFFLFATALLFLAAVSSLFFAGLMPPMGGAPFRFSELKKFHYFLIPFLVALAFLGSPRPMERHPFWLWWGGMGIFCSVIAALQFWGAYIFPSEWLTHRFFRPVIAGAGTNRFHGQGLMFFHLSFASCMCFVVTTGLARLLWPLKDDTRRVRVFWLVVAASAFIAVFYSYSRIALVVLAVVTGGLCFLKRPKLGIVAMLLLSIVATVVWKQADTLRSRFIHSNNTKSEREYMWRVSLVMFEDRPFTGVGFARTGGYSGLYAREAFKIEPRLVSHAHNNLLDIIAAMGIPGLIAYLAWWIFLFFASWRVYLFSKEEERWLPAAALGGLLAFQINGLTQVNFWDGKSQHTLMIWVGITLALWIRYRAPHSLAEKQS
jgi:O-antigen ligase